LSGVSRSTWHIAVHRADNAELPQAAHISSPTVGFKSEALAVEKIMLDRHY